MKYLIPTLMACFFSIAVSAQWSIGPRIAYGTITQSTQDIKIIPNSDRTPATMNYMGSGSVQSIGINFYNQLGPGFLQVETLGTKYSQQFSVVDNNSNDAGLNYYNENHYLLEVPVAAGVSIKNFKLGVGPVLEILVKKDSELETIESYENTARTVDGAFQGLLGYQKGIFSLDFRYAYKFASVVDGFALGNDVLKFNKSANRATLALGVFF